MPAILLLGVWFLLQVLDGSAGLVSAGEGGVAYFAHVGGFAFGLLTSGCWRPSVRKSRRASRCTDPVRTAVLTIAVVFIAALAALTVLDVVHYGLSAVDVLAVLVLVLFMTGIVGALRKPPNE